MSPRALVKSQLYRNYELFIEASYKTAGRPCVVVKLLQRGRTRQAAMLIDTSAYQ